MLGIVNLNFTIDRIHSVDNFREGDVFRPSSTFASGGGKGVNVARVLKTLGVKSELIGFLGGWTGRFIESSLGEEGLCIVPVRISGESRISTIVVDHARRRQTVINEQGACIRGREICGLIARYNGFIRGKEMIIMSGSIPRGVPRDIYARLIKIAGKRDIPVLLDTGRKELKEGLKAGPLIIKPNLAEFRELSGSRLASLKQIAGAVGKISGHKSEIVIVSLGEKGAMMGCGGKILLAVPPGIRAVNCVSSGDALVAGFVYSWLAGREAEYALRFGVACGTAAALTERTGCLRKSDLGIILPKVKMLNM